MLVAVNTVVVVSENAGTALAWNSNERCQRLGYGGSSLESVGFTATYMKAGMSLV